MAILNTLGFEAPSVSLWLIFPITVVAYLLARIIYLQFFHPLAKFPGPWWATSFSIFSALVSVKRREPEYLLYLVKRYGSDQPIRYSPTALLFPRPSALKDVYWGLNNKSRFYGSGALGPPALFTVLDGEEHKALRKALSNAPWTIGPLRKAWEPRFDEQVSLFVDKMREHAAAKRIVCLSDKCAEFAADIMSMISFTDAFGCVKNQRDEKNILQNWRHGLAFFGFASRCSFFRDSILPLPVIGPWLLPSISNNSGMGWLMCEADRQVTEREKLNREKLESKPDFLQHCLDARYPDGSPLTPVQKRAHVSLLIQAGADTTGTALGSTLRFLLLHDSILRRAREEIEAADKAGHLSTPIQFEETRHHLPFFVACIKEALRLQQPAPQIFPRLIPAGGKVIDGHFVPEGTEVFVNPHVVQRDRDFYGEDVEKYNPDRWMESEKRSFELEAAQMVFGMGPRVCIGKDIATMEMYKLLPEIIRRFDIDLLDPGKYVVSGGVGWNEGFDVRLRARDGE